MFTSMLIAPALISLVAIIILALLFTKGESFDRLESRLATSKISALAAGLVEVSGKTKTIEPLISPLTQTECIGYRYDIDKAKKDRKTGRTSYINKYTESRIHSFYLEDSTGSVVIDNSRLTANDVPYSDSKYEQKGAQEFRHSEYLLQENEQVLLIGRVNSENGKPIIQFDRQSEVFELKPLRVVQDDRRYRPMIRSMGYHLTAMLLVVAVMLVA